MSIKSSLYQYSFIINKVKRNPYCSLKDILNYVDGQFEELQKLHEIEMPGNSPRTFNRILKSINELFGVSIIYDEKSKGYYVEDGCKNVGTERLLEAFHIMEAIKISSNLEDAISMQYLSGYGKEHFSMILQAIKKNKSLEIGHQKFLGSELKQRIVVPYFLKEFKQRWYLIAKDQQDELVKTFALDRIENCEIIKTKLAVKNKATMKNLFDHCYGIICANNAVPKKIHLAFTAEQAPYVKSLPLHESQRILSVDEKETIIELKVFITYDFIMELLSFGDQVKVLSPVSLIKEIQSIHKNAAAQYNP